MMDHADQASASAVAQASTETWREMIERYKANNAISEEQEIALSRFYNEREFQLQQEIDAISAEYHERVARDGKAATDAWLKDSATRMGKRDRADAERMLESLGMHGDGDGD